MTFGVAVYNSSGSLVWDTLSATGGVIADSKNVASGFSGTYTYPGYAGRTPFLILASDTVPASITVDTALGYPRINISSVSVARKFVLAVI